MSKQGRRGKRLGIVVIDVRGDTIDRVKVRLARSRVDRWEDGKLLIIDLRQKDWCIALNILNGPGSPHSRARRSLDIIKARSLTWGVQIEDTLYACFLALASVNPPFTLLEVERLLMDGGFRNDVLTSVTDQYCLSWFARYDTLSSEQQLTWTLAAVNKITPLLTIPEVRRMLGQRDAVNFRHILDKPGSVILVGLNYAELHSAAFMLGSLIVSAVIQAIFSRVDVPEGDASRPPACLVLDEFQHLVEGSAFDELVAEMRRFGCFAVFSHQAISQTGGLADLLLNAVHLRMAFQTGAGDAAKISREVPRQFRSNVADRLLTLPTGHCFLIEKGGATRLVKAANSPDPAVSAEAVATLSTISAAFYARPAADVDAEIMARFAASSLGDIAAQQPKCSGTKPAKAPEPNAVYEVRPRKVRRIVPEEETTNDATSQATTVSQETDYPDPN